MKEFPYIDAYQGCERHHMPAKGAYKGHAKYRQECGPVIIMESLDHKRTKSWGQLRADRNYRDQVKLLYWQHTGQR